MRTIIIWDSPGEGPIQFIIVEGDYRHLDRIYINGGDVQDDEKETELNDLLYEADGKHKVERLNKFPLPLRKGDVVIVAGFEL